MSPIHHGKQPSALFAGMASQADDHSRVARIVAKTIYREARGAGIHVQAVIALATELLGLVAAEMKAARE